MFDEARIAARNMGDNIRVFRARQAPKAERRPVTVDPVLVLAANPVALTFQIETLRDQGCDVVVSADLRQIRDLLGMPERYWAMLIIEIEGFGGISAVIGRLLALRREQPDLPVVLTSTRMPAHDFSLERLPICDASLALPSLASELSVALQNALNNNQVWQQRLADLRQAIVAAAESDDAVDDTLDEAMPEYAEAG